MKKKKKEANKQNKTKIEIHKILQLLSMIFHILKLLHDFFHYQSYELYLFQCTQPNNHSFINFPFG